MSITGRPDGEPGAGPQKVGVALTDLFTGLYATHRHPGRAGEARAAPGAASTSTWRCSTCGRHAWPTRPRNYLITGMAPQRLGNAHPSIVPYQDFPTADGDMMLAVGNDGQFAALLRSWPAIPSGRRCALRDQRAARRATAKR